MSFFNTGDTGKSVTFRVFDDSGLPVTALVAATMPDIYWSPSEGDGTKITLVDLSAIGAAWESGGVHEKAGSDGVYRLDLPDAALASPDEITIYGEASGKHVVCEPITVGPVPANALTVSDKTGYALTVAYDAAKSAAQAGAQMDLVNAPNATAVAAIQNGLATITNQNNILNFIESNGSGANTVTITVNDGINPLQGAKVRVTNGLLSYIKSTNTNGQVVFNLDNLTWVVSITNPNYSFGGSDLIVSGTTAQTYSMTALAITPSPPGYTTGFAVCYDQNGNTLENVSVSCLLIQIASSDTGHVYDNVAVTVISDSNGLVQFPNLVLGATYQFSRGGTKPYNLVIPTTAGSTYALPSIIGNP